MDIGRIITKYGKTQAEVAEALDSTAGYISQLKSGKTNPSMKRLDELAAVIGCQRWEFFEDEIEAAGFSIVKNGQQPAPTDNVEPAADDAAGQEQVRQTETAAEKKAEETRVLRFQYDCPHCGESVKISIEKA